MATLSDDSAGAGLANRFAGLHPVAAAASVVVSGYITICLCFTGLGLLLTHQLGAVTRWDENVNRWFADNRTPKADDWSDKLTRLADTLGVLVVLLAAVLVMLILRHRWEALLLGIALGLELVTFLTVNYFVGRPRPDVVRLGSLPSTSSFPSGHTAATAALYGGVAMLCSARFRTRVPAAVWWLIAVLLTTSVGVARVYRGMHHPSDVTAGALLGVAVLVVAVVAERACRIAVAGRRHKAEEIGDRLTVAEQAESSRSQR